MNYELLVEQFSPSRLQPYFDAAQGDTDLAADLYDWNIQMSGAWLEDLSVIEVLLRNAFDRVLREEFGHEWYDENGVLLVAQGQAIDDAKQKIRDHSGTSATGDQVVAELPFGFWRSLLGRRYDVTLWPVLREAFAHRAPTAKVHQEDVEQRVGDLVELRNDIAHHWPIFDWRFDHSIQNAKQIAGSISPAVQVWLVKRSRVPEVLRDHPLR